MKPPGGAKMKKTKYTKEFKQEAVTLARQEGNNFQQVADDLGIHVKTLYNWSNQLKKHGDEAFPGSGNLRSEQTELAQLRKELKRVKQERDILKKAVQFFAKE